MSHGKGFLTIAAFSAYVQRLQLPKKVVPEKQKIYCLFAIGEQDAILSFKTRLAFDIEELKPNELYKEKNQNS
ncbi:hypothetical protein MUP77_01225 [Candidatus Bathyarchaeota archaeon]|nr:hypothetical protein [Candidatus Bathyarchaeota archaeon]